MKAREKIASSEYQRSGEWLHLWRIAGKFGNISIFDVSDHDRLHEILWSLPLFPFMTIRCCRSRATPRPSIDLRPDRHRSHRR